MADASTSAGAGTTPASACASTPGVWSPSSWRAKPVDQMVEYKDPAALEDALAKAKALPPLFSPGETDALRAQLADVAAGKRFLLQVVAVARWPLPARRAAQCMSLKRGSRPPACPRTPGQYPPRRTHAHPRTRAHARQAHCTGANFLSVLFPAPSLASPLPLPHPYPPSPPACWQGGDCAERFADCNSDAIEQKLKIMLQMSLVLTWGARVPTVRVARMAGQFAKPRSKATELVDGVEYFSFRGDNVNSHDLSQRDPDPQRLIDGYFRLSPTRNVVCWPCADHVRGSAPAVCAGLLANHMLTSC